MNDLPEQLNGIWDYLERCGVLENGTSEDIENARKRYWKEYNRRYKKRSRKQKPEINIAFPDGALLERTRQAAKAHNRPTSLFVRDLIEAYLDKTYMQPSPKRWEEVQQTLFLTEIQIRQIAEDDDGAINYLRNYNLIFEKLLELESIIKGEFNTAKILKDAVTESVVKQPWIKEELIKHLNTI